MSVTTEASSLFELPGVNNAVERLQELGVSSVESFAIWVVGHTDSQDPSRVKSPLTTIHPIYRCFFEDN